MAPQLITIALFIIVIFAAISHHGRPRPKSTPFASLIVSLLILSLYWWGGFFDGILPIGLNDWPKVLVFVYSFMIVGSAFLDFGPKKNNAYWGIFFGCVFQYVLYCGGFYDVFFQS